MLAGSDVLSPAYRAWLEWLETYAGECAVCHDVDDVIFFDEQGRLFSICPPCLEAKRIWSGTLGRTLSVLDTEALMTHLRRTRTSYASVQELIETVVVEKGLLAPLAGDGR
jgi:hypothetical protein